MDRLRAIPGHEKSPRRMAGLFKIYQQPRRDQRLMAAENFETMVSSGFKNRLARSP
jgi:hypothetical protein